MAAAREEGFYSLRVVKANGSEVEVYRTRSEVLGPSGQVAVPSEWTYIPTSQDAAPGGAFLRIYFISDATDILDSTDCTYVSMPCAIQPTAGAQMQFTTLSGKDFQNSDVTGFTKFTDASLTANVSILIGEYPVPASYYAMTFGGGKAFWVSFDDTA